MAEAPAPTRLYPGDPTPDAPSFDDDWFRFYGPREAPTHFEVHELCGHFECAYRAGPCPWHPADCECSVPPCWDPMFAPQDVSVLAARVEELHLALEALLDHAERIQEHVPKSENWYAVRDCARNALEGRASAYGPQATVIHHPDGPRSDSNLVALSSACHRGDHAGCEHHQPGKPHDCQCTCHDSGRLS